MTYDDDLWAVLLHETYAYGPFEEKDLARRFADFLSAEVDPAHVVPLRSIEPHGRIVWRSPVIELLNWYERPAGDAA